MQIHPDSICSESHYWLAKCLLNLSVENYSVTLVTGTLTARRDIIKKKQLF